MLINGPETNTNSTTHESKDGGNITVESSSNVTFKPKNSDGEDEVVVLKKKDVQKIWAAILAIAAVLGIPVYGPALDGTLHADQNDKLVEIENAATQKYIDYVGTLMNIDAVKKLQEFGVSIDALATYVSLSPPEIGSTDTASRGVYNAITNLLGEKKFSATINSATGYLEIQLPEMTGKTGEGGPVTIPAQTIKIPLNLDNVTLTGTQTTDAAIGNIKSADKVIDDAKKNSKKE